MNEELAYKCDRKVWRSANFLPYTDTNNVHTLDEQLKLAHKVVKVLDRPYRMICVTLLRYNLEDPEKSYALGRLSARKNGDEKIQRIVYVN